MQCNSMQGLYARLTGEDIALFYIYIDAVYWNARPLWSIDRGGHRPLLYIYRCSVTVCKASMFN